MNDDPTEFTWESNTGLGSIEAWRPQTGGIVVTLTDGPLNNRIRTTLRLPPEVVARFLRWAAAEAG